MRPIQKNLRGLEFFTVTGQLADFAITPLGKMPVKKLHFQVRQHYLKTNCVNSF